MTELGETTISERTGSDTEISKRNQEIEQEFPGIQEIFDLLLQKGFSDADLDPEGYGSSELPIRAGIAHFDEARGKWMLQITGDNRTNGAGLSTEHAEKRAIEIYEKYFHSKHIPSNSMLVSTFEPCSMCASALVHSLAHGGGGTIIYGASQDDLRGKAVELTTGATFNEETGNVEVTKAVKQLRTEPPGYHSEEFVSERNPQIRVIGGYRRDEVLDFMKIIQSHYDIK